MSLEAAETPAAPSEAPAQTPSQNMEDRFQSLVERGLLNTEAAPTAQAPVSAPGQTAQADPAVAQAEPEEAAYTSIDEYLSQAKLDRESFYTLPVTVKIDGESKLVPLAEALKSYQLEGHVQKKSIALAESQRVWEAERQAAQQALGQQLQNVQALGTMAQQALFEEFKSVDWTKLQQEDPTRWVMLNQQFQNKSNAIQNQLYQVQQHQQALQAQQQQELSSKVLPAEKEKMLEANPVWRDEKKFSADQAAIRQYAQHRGYTPAELGTIFDHRHMLTLHDAAQWRALQAQMPEVTKRLRAVPQVAQPGSRQTRDPKAVAHQQAREAWARNPRNEDAAAAAFERYA